MFAMVVDELISIVEHLESNPVQGIHLLQSSRTVLKILKVE